MNISNKKELWQLIQKKGDSLSGLLPDHEFHPKGRNPYAHVCSLIKSYFGLSYKDIPSEDFKKLKEFIEKINQDD